MSLVKKHPQINSFSVLFGAVHETAMGGLLRCLSVFTLIGLVVGTGSARSDEAAKRPDVVQGFITSTCLDCHDSKTAKGGLDLESFGFDLSRREVFNRWLLIHDRVAAGEMPPPDDGIPQRVVPIGWTALTKDAKDVAGSRSDVQLMLKVLAESLIGTDRQRVDASGRSKVRRLNRYEYENALRELLNAPWLQVAELLPEDGVDHLFNKIGERLDVSHVQMTRYLSTAEQSLRLAVDAAAHPSTTRKFFAREERSMQNFLHYRFGQNAATRSIVPLLGLTTEPEIIRKQQPVTVGDSDPERREQEAMGVFSGVYTATTKYDFTRIKAPTDGTYRIRFKTYSFMAGPNGADGGEDQGLTGGNRAWWRPDRNVVLHGNRTEPITLYALGESGESRWLTTFDSHPEPTVFECVVLLRKGDGIRPDAARLVRTRPGWSGNPNATEEGVPGFAMHWMEVEGPLQETWPPASYMAVFDDLPFTVDENRKVRVDSQHQPDDARRLLTRFFLRTVSGTTSTDSSVEPYMNVYRQAIAHGQDFTDAVISATSAILCSPEFLYLEAQPGPLPAFAFQQRLAYFLWNGPPELDSTLAKDRGSAIEIRNTVDRMLDDPRRDRFVNAFLDYWLNLREINANAPDAELYPEYYLDELLTESSIRETQMFVGELIDKDLPVRNFIEADFAFVNERLAEHYGLPVFEGVQLRRVQLPNDSPRGGLLTQASVLRITANGTTTSPVVRGAWIMKRIAGVDIPSPPSGVAAVEPDIRGATTIREQLEKHRAIESCNACHSRFDPVGFALESFDVAGGWRDRYRTTGDLGDPVKGFGKNGHAFKFKLAQPIDCSGKLRSGQAFNNIRELKRLLASDGRQLGRNLLYQLIVYATGAPVSFCDRIEVEAMLDRAAEKDYGVRTLIHEVVQSEIFRNK